MSSSSRGNRARPSADYQRGYEGGRAEAERALVDGKPSLYVFGRRDVTNCLDRETGLPLVAVAGCFVDDETEGRADGNNEHVRAHIAAHGLPLSSRKPFEADLFDLAGYVARTAANLCEFEIDGPETASRDGRLRVRVWRPLEKGKRSPLPSVRVTLVADDTPGSAPQEVIVESFLPLGFGGAHPAFVPGPRGSDTLVVRGEQPPPKGHLAFVLLGLRGESGWLRIEHRIENRAMDSG